MHTENDKKFLVALASVFNRPSSWDQQHLSYNRKTCPGKAGVDENNKLAWQPDQEVTSSNRIDLLDHEFWHVDTDPEEDEIQTTVFQVVNGEGFHTMIIDCLGDADEEDHMRLQLIFLHSPSNDSPSNRDQNVGTAYIIEEPEKETLENFLQQSEVASTVTTDEDPSHIQLKKLDSYLMVDLGPRGAQYAEDTFQAPGWYKHPKGERILYWFDSRPNPPESHSVLHGDLTRLTLGRFEETVSVLTQESEIHGSKESMSVVSRPSTLQDTAEVRQ